MFCTKTASNENLIFSLHKLLFYDFTIHFVMYSQSSYKICLFFNYFCNITEFKQPVIDATITECMIKIKCYLLFTQELYFK